MYEESKSNTEPGDAHGHLVHPAVGPSLEVILVERPVAHVHRARGDIVVVVARVLRVEPADQPEVEMGVSIELNEMTRRRVVADEALPEARLAREVDHELRQCRAIEVRVLGDPLVDPASQSLEPSSRAGFWWQSASATASPKPRTASRPCSGSRTGTSVPKTSWLTPNVARQSSSARFP